MYSLECLQYLIPTLAAHCIAYSYAHQSKD